MIFRHFQIAVSDKRPVNLNSRYNAGRRQVNILPGSISVRTCGSDIGDFQTVRVLKLGWHCKKTTKRSSGHGPVIWERRPLGLCCQPSMSIFSISVARKILTELLT